ncbi:MAG TPA: hypothetical protein VF598_06870 [Hymenobacter sp.]|jgi:hypothetical protein
MESTVPTLSQLDFQKLLLEVDKKLTDEVIPIDYAFQKAACVLVRFEPERLYPFLGLNSLDTSPSPGWNGFLRYCKPFRSQQEGNWWQLREEVRYEALLSLGTQEQMKAALQANPERIQDVAQQYLDNIIIHGGIEIKGLSRQELVTLSKILNWLEESLDYVGPIKKAVAYALPMADLLEPFRRLTSTSFVGRQTELVELSDYVGVVPPIKWLNKIKRAATQALRLFTDNQPLLIYGTGGIGKSTLLSKFILDHVDAPGSSQPVSLYTAPDLGLSLDRVKAFAYLDLDRPGLDLEQPTTFLKEVARQLAIQLPDDQSDYNNFVKNVNEDLNLYDISESAKALSAQEYRTSNSAASSLGSIISQCRGRVLLVIDTFEEAQFLGKDIVQAIWETLTELTSRANNLRIVVAGRAKVDQADQTILLQELSKEEGHALLRTALFDSSSTNISLDSTINEIITAVGLNPMSLRLAVSIVLKHGIESLRQVETRRLLFVRVRTEVIQARLYGRILTHIHNEEVRKLAYPGLIVRRISIPVIRFVLAEACKLSVKTDGEAEVLFWELAREVSLVEMDSEGSLLHRQDVRRVMLQDLNEQVSPKVVLTIHNQAIAYYAQFDDEISRAEEIYHRLIRKDPIERINERWLPGLETRLNTAMEEIPEKSRSWLAAKLGVTPDPEVLERAHQDEWEEITALRISRYLRRGSAQQALVELRRRSERSPSSQLYKLELETLRTLRRFDEAAELVKRILISPGISNNFTNLRDVLMQGALIAEAQGDIHKAVGYLSQAYKTLSLAVDDIERLRVLITYIRLLRKAGDNQDLRQFLISQAKKFIENELVSVLLKSHPTLLQEAVAEIGKSTPKVLNTALNILGLKAQNNKGVKKLAQALVTLNNELTSKPQNIFGSLTERAGLQENTKEKWENYIIQQGADIGRTLNHWRKEALPQNSESKASIKLNNAMVNIFRRNVEDSLASEDTPQSPF